MEYLTNDRHINNQLFYKQNIQVRLWIQWDLYLSFR